MKNEVIHAYGTLKFFQITENLSSFIFPQFPAVLQKYSHETACRPQFEKHISLYSYNFYLQAV
jgi:hypothetical protein